MARLAGGKIRDSRRDRSIPATLSLLLNDAQQGSHLRNVDGPHSRIMAMNPVLWSSRRELRCVKNSPPRLMTRSADDPARIVIVCSLSLFIIFGIRLSFSVFFRRIRPDRRLEQRSRRRHLQPEYALLRPDRAAGRHRARPLRAASRLRSWRPADGRGSLAEQPGELIDRSAAFIRRD